MATVSLTGNDVVTLNGRVFHDFGSGDVAKLTFDGDLVVVTPSKNGNIVYGLNVAGFMSKLALKLILGSSDDQYLNSLLAAQNLDFATTILIVGSFVKRVGDGQGNVTNVIYNTLGGVVSKFPGASTNTTGSAEQSMVDYEVHFGNNSRAIM